MESFVHCPAGEILQRVSLINFGGCALLDVMESTVMRLHSHLACSPAGSTPQGASGTFNYLIDLITQVPATREMYMRRLRTLTDQYYPSGKLVSVSAVAHWSESL